jgi:hypothetical protein
MWQAADAAGRRCPQMTQMAQMTGPQMARLTTPPMAQMT